METAAIEAPPHADGKSILPPRRDDDRSRHVHRQLIGTIGLFLPLLLYVMAGVRRTDPLEPWRLLDSVSAYYYTAAVVAFVGLLAALALALFSYEGYRNDQGWADRMAGFMGGFAALGVALFPTRAPADALTLPWWTPANGIIHYVSAAVLFLVFAVFSLWLFRLTKKGEVPTPAKKRRNRVYLICGLVIVAGILWAAIDGWRNRPIFLPEALALTAFAVSWLVKGYAHVAVASVARRALGR